MGYNVAGDAAGAGSAYLVEGEERHPRHDPVLAQTGEQRDVPLEEHETSVLTDASKQAGQVDQFAGSPPRPDGERHDPTGAQHGRALGEHLVHGVEEPVEADMREVGRVGGVAVVALGHPRSRLGVDLAVERMVHRAGW